MNKILMKINSYQRTRESDDDKMELLTEGRHYNKNGIVYLIYEETELCGIKGCVTTFKVDGDVVKLRRYGLKSQEMHFEKGKRFKGLYETPFGYCDMEIMTNNVENNLRRDGTSGSLVIDYDVSLKGLVESHNTIEIRVALIKEK